MKNSRLKCVFNKVINVILPPLCPMCGEYVDTPDTLCPDCFSKLDFITKPFCEKCGYPFEFDVKGDCLCGACLKKTPKYHCARSVFVYNEGSKELILPFKHADRTDLTRILSTLLLQTYRPLIRGADLIIPVPLHITRLFKRRYNQSALLAKRLAKIEKKIYAPSVLYRKRSTPSQGHMNFKQRCMNVKNAFGVRHVNMLENKKVLLIDDVMTTGATVSECTKMLLAAGVSQVDVLTVARVCH